VSEIMGNVLPSPLVLLIKDKKSSSPQDLNPKTHLPVVGNEDLSSQSSSSPPVLSIKDDSFSSQLQLPVTDNEVSNKNIIDLSISSVKEPLKRLEYAFDTQGYDDSIITMNKSTFKYLKPNNGISEGVFKFVLKNDGIDNNANVSTNFSTYYVYVLYSLTVLYVYMLKHVYLLYLLHIIH
jgi:hypothetical protein